MHEPYAPEWTEELKESIRARDNYLCQMCGASGKEIHHIDYDKKNCQPDNLITLCKSCHGKTFKHHAYWAEFLPGLVHKILE